MSVCLSKYVSFGVCVQIQAIRQKLKAFLKKTLPLALDHASHHRNYRATSNRTQGVNINVCIHT